jgi:hypothetical protein
VHFDAFGRLSFGQITVTAGVNATVNLAGVAATGQAGTITPQVEKSLTGVQGVSGVGQVSGEVANAFAGVSASGQVGSLVPSVAVLVVGVGATGLAGDQIASLSEELQGVSGSGQAGSVLPVIDEPLSGVSATGFAGSVTANPAGVGIGVEGAGQAGQVGVIISGGGGKKEERAPTRRRKVAPPFKRMIEVIGEDGLPKKVPLLDRFAPPPPLVLAPDELGRTDTTLAPFELPPIPAMSGAQLARSVAEQNEMADALAAIMMIPDEAMETARDTVHAMMALAAIPDDAMDAAKELAGDFLVKLLEDA